MPGACGLELRFDADGGNALVGDDQPLAAAVLGLAPRGIAWLAVGFNLLQGALFDHRTGLLAFFEGAVHDAPQLPRAGPVPKWFPLSLDILARGV
ncbi:MAG: hypothetical protein ACKOED_08250 [Aestuariivirga sp.]|uniref:hypothetical protein n=1 Tax=Aestuariivirga sp. TaxID=2650926 RepID=UPI0038D14B24